MLVCENMTVEVPIRDSPNPCLLDDDNVDMFVGKELYLDADGDVVYDHGGRTYFVKDQVMIKAERDHRTFPRGARAWQRFVKARADPKH